MRLLNGTVAVKCENRTVWRIQQVVTPVPIGTGTWVILTANYAVQQMWMVLSMTALMVLINNSCIQAVRGTVNGLHIPPV